MAYVGGQGASAFPGLPGNMQVLDGQEAWTVSGLVRGTTASTRQSLALRRAQIQAEATAINQGRIRPINFDRIEYVEPTTFNFVNGITGINQVLATLWNRGHRDFRVKVLRFVGTRIQAKPAVVEAPTGGIQLQAPNGQTVTIAAGRRMVAPGLGDSSVIGYNVFISSRPHLTASGEVIISNRQLVNSSGATPKYEYLGTRPVKGIRPNYSKGYYLMTGLTSTQLDQHINNALLTLCARLPTDLAQECAIDVQYVADANIWWGTAVLRAVVTQARKDRNGQPRPQQTPTAVSNPPAVVNKPVTDLPGSAQNPTGGPTSVPPGQGGVQGGPPTAAETAMDFQSTGQAAPTETRPNATAQDLQNIYNTLVQIAGEMQQIEDDFNQGGTTGTTGQNATFDNILNQTTQLSTFAAAVLVPPNTVQELAAGLEGLRTFIDAFQTAKAGNGGALLNPTDYPSYETAIVAVTNAAAILVANAGVTPQA